MCLGPELATAAAAGGGIAGSGISLGTIASMLSTGIGTIMQQRAQQQARRKQNEQAIAELQRQEAIQRSANDAIQRHTQEFEPQLREERQQQIADSLGETYTRALDTADAAAPRSEFQVAGDVSDDYLSHAARAQASQLQRGTYLAGLLAQLDAPKYALDQEQDATRSFSAALSGLGRNSRVSNQISGMEIARAGEVDPWMSGLGAAVSGAGSLVGGAVDNLFAPAATTASTQRQPATSPFFSPTPTHSGISVTRLR